MQKQENAIYEQWRPVFPCVVCGKDAYGICPHAGEPLCPLHHEENCDYAVKEVSYKFVREDYLGTLICGWADCLDKSFIRVMGLDETYLCQYHARMWFRGLSLE